MSIIFSSAVSSITDPSRAYLSITWHASHQRSCVDGDVDAAPARATLQAAGLAIADRLHHRGAARVGLRLVVGEWRTCLLRLSVAAPLPMVAAVAVAVGASSCGVFSHQTSTKCCSCSGSGGCGGGCREGIQAIGVLLACVWRR